MQVPWTLELLGTLQAKTTHVTVSRFRTRGVGLLLAYLAYYRRSHTRDELAEMLWPDIDSEVARRRLRMALSLLRHHLAQPPTPMGEALEVGQGLVSLNLQYFLVDVAEFERLVHFATSQTTDAEKLATLRQAIGLYKGEFLPGYYEDWVEQERLRLEDLLVSALQSAIRLCETEGKTDEGIRYAQMAIGKDPFNEGIHANLMRFYLASKRPGKALQHAEKLKSTLASELGTEPCPEIESLIEKAKRESVSYASHALEGDRETPSVSSADTPVVKLPVQLNRIYGRSTEQRQVIEKFEIGRARLVTLLGPGGIGKTRLAIEIGQALAQEKNWNVWFVSLADISEASAVSEAVLESLQIQKDKVHSPTELIRATVGGQRNLLILDNLEHILGDATLFIKSLLQEVPAVSFLTTSRQSLKIEGEHEVSLPPLPLPNLGTLESYDEEFTAVPSVQLFLDRAQAVCPEFQVDGRNASTVASLCNNLDGLPLALEIAAGLLGAFSLTQLSANLDHRLSLLHSRRRDLSERHQSLRAMIEYSYELLTSEQQRFFRGLSIFRGGFTIEAAFQICGHQPDIESSQKMILDLQERSLILRDEEAENGPLRFRLLESFREFGNDQLDKDEKAAIRERHAAFYLRLVSSTVKTGALFEHVHNSDRENRIEAIQFFFEQRCWHECISLLESLHGLSQKGQKIMDSLLKTSEFQKLNPIDQISLLRVSSTNKLLLASEFDSAYEDCKQALTIATENGLEEQMAQCLRKMSGMAFYVGLSAEAIEYCEKAIAYGRANDDLEFLTIVHSNLGVNLRLLGDNDRARSAFDSALETGNKIHGEGAFWPVYYNLASLCIHSGDLDEGLQFANQGLGGAREANNLFGVSMCLSMTSLYHRKCGNLAEALETSREVMLLRKRFGYPFWTITAIHDHASILFDLGFCREAVTLFAASRIFAKAHSMNEQEFADDISKAKGKLPEAAFEEAWAKGLKISVNEAFQMAVQLH